MGGYRDKYAAKRALGSVITVRPGLRDLIRKLSQDSVFVEKSAEFGSIAGIECGKRSVHHLLVHRLPYLAG